MKKKHCFLILLIYVSVISVANLAWNIYFLATKPLSAGGIFNIAKNSVVEIMAETEDVGVSYGSGVIVAKNGTRYAVKELTYTVRYEMQNGLYWLATADKNTGKMYISTAVVTISITSSAMKVGLSCYTPSFADAYNVAKIASDGLQPVHDEAHEVEYFNHYHRVNRKGVAHAFYGSPRAV